MIIFVENVKFLSSANSHDFVLPTARVALTTYTDVSTAKHPVPILRTEVIDAVLTIWYLVQREAPDRPICNLFIRSHLNSELCLKV